MATSRTRQTYNRDYHTRISSDTLTMWLESSVNSNRTTQSCAVLVIARRQQVDPRLLFALTVIRNTYITTQLLLETEKLPASVWQADNM